MPSDPPGGIASLSEEARRELLSIARNAVESQLEHGALADAPPVSDRLKAPGAAFVTVTLHGRLRGCIGYTEAVAPLYRTVQECAVAAATEDPRFPPVTREEIRRLRFAVSVLSPLFPVEPADVRVGVHGLVVSQGNRRGLLLPQVATEFDWSRETFVSQACVKAGLPPDAWKHGARILAFTAEVLSEEE
jgi:AmmeMemoRadiSam system protein A